jgi:hypothetical protein
MLIYGCPILLEFPLLLITSKIIFFVIKVNNMNIENKPHGYEDLEIYNELTVCSNLLINTVHIFQSGTGWNPLVIRKGKVPRVWLSAQEITDNGSPKIIELIADSKSLNNEFHIDKSKHGFQIKYQNKVIVKAGNHVDSRLEVINIDFRSIGLNIYGDNNSLSLGSNKMSQNTSKNSQVMFGF